MKIWSFFNSKILVRNLIIIVLLFTCTFIIINKFVYEKMKDDALKQILLTTKMANIKISEVFAQTKLISEQMETNNDFKDYIREVKTRNDILSHPLYPRVLDSLKSITSVNKGFYLAWISNEKANFCLDSLGNITDESYTAHIRPWYQHATESFEASFSQPYYEYTTNKFCISCVKAVRENDEIIGYVSVDISLDSLPAIMKNFTIGKNGKNILLTNHGTTVFTSEAEDNKALISITDLLSHIESLKLHEKEYEEIKINGKDYYLTYSIVDVNNWGIIQLIDKDEMMEPFHKTMRMMMYIFLISCILSFSIVTLSIIEQKKIQKKLKEEASTDYLTGIGNRKYFAEKALLAFQDSKEQNNSLSLFIIDIDQFKTINDTYGHDVGDLVIKKTVEEFKKAITKNDILCRLGGDEFVIILPDTNKSLALMIAERIINNISQLEIITEKGSFNYTISVGVSSRHSDDTDFDALLKRADQALYQAKNSGRNKASLSLVSGDG